MKKGRLIVGLAAVAVAGGGVVLSSSHKTGAGAAVFIANDTDEAATVYVSFGADSAVKAADWSSFCTVTAPLNCNFQMGPRSTQPTMGSGKYLNVTISYNGQGCGATKAELNIRNPKWYNILDVSLVDGYSNKVSITNIHGSEKTVFGPPVGEHGNEQLLGVFPYGCDICTARQHPPCGIVPGGSGCKAGTQYDPHPPCQWQSPYGKGDADNSHITVALVK